jgi:hypothetical protein
MLDFRIDYIQFLETSPPAFGVASVGNIHAQGKQCLLPNYCALRNSWASTTQATRLNLWRGKNQDYFQVWDLSPLKPFSRHE